VIEAPLFPSYIFVNISNKEYYEVLTHSSALRYVCFNGKAVSIPINQINTIKETINASYNIETGAINYKKGQEICINEGVFSSLVGEIISKEGKKKVLIKIKNIGYSLIIDVPAKYLSNCH